MTLLLLLALQAPADFDHMKHARLFPSCTSCHAGATVEGAGQSLWPPATTCASCHNGTVQPVVAWRARSTSRRSNLSFNHQQHARDTGTRAPSCAACHTAAGTPRMDVREPVVSRCLDCHGIRTAHLAAPDSACATCHVPLARATALTRQDVAGFPAPPSHADPNWAGPEGHGKAGARATNACATCHAREFCSQCHAGGALPPAVAVMASDPRSTAIAVRRTPPSHGSNFADRHATIAAAGAARCSGCHVRSDCLECHRPAATRSAAYHDDGFLSRHPAAAYARESSCSDCHNERSFCTACHTQAGLVASRGLRTSYHDSRQFFVAGHGVAARQSLESCVSCHTERDCLSCHSALGGRRFNPHGPGFDASRLRRKNFEMCTVCHGAAVPGR